MPSELEQLPDLCGYLKRASSPGWLKVEFSDAAARNAAFLEDSPYQALMELRHVRNSMSPRR